MVAALVVAAPAEAARPCKEVDRDALAAQEAGDLETLKRFYTEAHHPEAGCDPLFLVSFGSDLALAHIDRFVALNNQDGNLQAHIHVLEEARNYGEPWQLLATLAGAQAELGNHELAASYYQQTIQELQVVSRSADPNSPVMANLPNEEKFDEMVRSMAQSALLAQTFSPPARSRSSDAYGLFVEAYRGYVVKAVPVPVQFHFDSTRFTGKGEQVAAYLLDYLLNEDLVYVKLVGHTDPKGDEYYNLGLSERRAAALRDYLYAGGYDGTIDVEGRGETEPFQPVDPSKFANDIEARHQLDRRVELVRNPDG